MDSVFGTKEVNPDSLTGTNEYMQKLTELIRNYVRDKGKHVSFRRIEEYLEKNKDIDIDVEDAYERTPLMIACGEGAEDIVVLLLKEGANPNKKCKELNTPLHYACRLDPSHLNYPYNCLAQQNYPLREISRRDPLNLVNVLIEHGATFESNIHGWTPAHYAAFYEMTDVVEFFSKDHGIALSISDIIMTFEILVFTLSVFQNNLSSAKRYLEKALKLRLENGYSVQKDRLTDLEKCFGHTECTNVAELSRVNDLDCVKIQGFLIGDRVLPECIKDEWLWPSLFWTYRETPNQFLFRLYDMFLRLESQGKVSNGTTLNAITDLLRHSYFNREDEIKVACQHANQLINFFKTYKCIIVNSHQLTLACRLATTFDLVNEVQSMLYRLMYSSTDDMALIFPYLSVMAELAGALNEAADKCNVKKYGTSMFYLYRNIGGGDITFDILRLYRPKKFEMVMQSYEFLLKLEDPSYQDPDTGETILHHLISYLIKFHRHSDMRMIGETPSPYRHIELVLHVVRKVIRHGCSVVLKDKQGHSAEGLVKRLQTQFKHVSGTYEKYKELVEVLQTSPVDMSLQELAARVIIQKNIPYRGMIPNSLCEFIDDPWPAERSDYKMVWDMDAWLEHHPGMHHLMRIFWRSSAPPPPARLPRDDQT